MYPDLISRGFRRNQRVIALHCEGMSHEDALRQSGYNTNCFNWVLGHMLANRNEVLKVLGLSAVLGDGAVDRYLQETEPIREDGPGVLALSDLLGALDETATRIAAALAAADDAFMAVELPAGEGRTATRAAQVMFLFFHDTYHAGQTDVIRQLSGKSDKII